MKRKIVSIKKKLSYFPLSMNKFSSPISFEIHLSPNYPFIHYLSIIFFFQLNVLVKLSAT